MGIKIIKTKICTDIDQSKKLTESGIDINTADIIYNILDESYIRHDTPIDKYHTPAWSLTALMNILPQGTRLLKSATDEMYHCDCPEGNVDKWFDNPVDAAYEMIIWLKENNNL